MNMAVLTVAIAFEIFFVNVILWIFFHEKAVVNFEDKIIRAVIRGFRKRKSAIKTVLYDACRNLVLFFYEPYRRKKKKLLLKLLKDFNLQIER